MRTLQRIKGNSLSVTHICDGEEVVTGGEDGQVWVATFAVAETADKFVASVRSQEVWGECKGE